MKAKSMRFVMPITRGDETFDVVVLGEYTPGIPPIQTWGGFTAPEPSEFYFEAIFRDGPYGEPVDLTMEEFEEADRIAGENFHKGILDDRYDTPDTEGSYRSHIERIKSRKTAEGE